MDSPLEPKLTNVFICHFEKIWLEICPAHFKLIFNRRIVNDTLLLCRSKDHVQRMKNSLNKQHKNIKFMSKIEKNGSLSFLDITISHQSNKFVTSVYRKPAFSAVFISFENFMPHVYKHVFIKNFLHRSFRLCSNYENFHRKIESLKSLFKHNIYQKKFVNQRINKFLNKLFIKKTLISWFLKGS